MKKLLTLVFAVTLIASMLPGSVYSQATKKVLIEDFTSSTCGPCASLNPSFHAWVDERRNDLTVVSFHMNWPAPNNDPMYLANPSENTTRRNYYGVNSIPEIIMEGIKTYIGTIGGMTTWFNYFTAITTPVAITISDTRVAPDSMVTNVQITNLSALPSGTYTLKVFAVEHSIYIASDPGLTNGEHTFPDVFRKALTSINGNSISGNAGTYNFQYRYRKDPAWVDSMMYTVAFVQNDVDKSLMNAKSSNYDNLTAVDPYSNEVPSSFALFQNYPNPFNPTTNIKFNLPKSGFVTLKLYDILGNEVQSLVSGIQQAGVYNITVDGSNLASGVYFYTLRTDSYLETKKMALIK